MDLLDERNCGWLLQHVHDLLKPGGQVLFYESNPWNPVLKLRRLTGRLFGGADPRHCCCSRPLYELMSEMGFIRVFAVYNDFVYRPLTPPVGVAVAQPVDPAGERAGGAALGRVDPRARPEARRG